MFQLPQPKDRHSILPASVSGRPEFPISLSDSIASSNISGGFTEPDEGNLLHYWQILRRRSGVLLAITLLGAGIGYLVAIPQTPIYRVRTSLEIVGLNRDFMSVKGSSPINEGGTSSDSIDLQTQVRILQSASLLDRVSQKLRSAATPKIESAPFQIYWRRLLKLPEPSQDELGKQAIAYARDHVEARTAGQTRIIEVSVDAPSPEAAAQFANTLANEFIEQNLEARWKTTEHTGEWLSRQLDDMRVRLQRSEDRLQVYARDAGLVFTADNTNVSTENLRLVQESFSKAQIERISKESRAAMASTLAPADLSSLLEDPVLRDYQAKIAELNRQEAELQAIYTPEHAKVVKVQAQIASLRNAMSSEQATILKRIRSEYDEALRREGLLAAGYAEQRRLVTGEGEKSIQYNILRQEVESNRQLYDTVLQQLKQSTLASAMHASNMRVLDPAQQPDKPFKPNVPITAGLGLFGGFFLGAAILVLRERGDRSIHNPGDTPLFLGVPELGIIPVSGKQYRLRVRKQPTTLDRPGENRYLAPVAVASKQSVELVTWQSRASVAAESFRATLVSILFSHNAASAPRTLVVTSGSPSEGKSTVASNLGIAVAEVNQRVLLIDADMRRPRLHSIFNLDNNQGLCDLLRSPDNTLAGSLGCIHETGVPGLSVMTSGSMTTAATSLLYSQRMPALLEILKAHFDLVIVDTPPMLQIPDARILARMVDGVVLVIRAGQTTRDAAIAARRRFAEDGTELMGTILNDWDPKESSNGYYGYSDGYYNKYKDTYSKAS
jgi:capsular exopolysaccharide synthesis family protein